MMQEEEIVSNDRTTTMMQEEEIVSNDRTTTMMVNTESEPAHTDKVSVEICFILMPWTYCYGLSKIFLCSWIKMIQPTIQNVLSISQAHLFGAFLETAAPRLL